MLRRLGVRGKILATLAVPVLVLLLAFGVLANQAISTYNQARLQSDFLDAVQGQETLIAAIQSERHYAVLTAHGDKKAKAQFDEAAAITDAARSAFDRALTQIDASALAAEAVAALKLAQEARSDQRIDRQRNWVEDGLIAPLVIATNYSAIIKPHLNLADVLANTLENRQLATYVNAYAATSRLVDQIHFEGLAGQVHLDLETSGDAVESERRNLSVIVNQTDAARLTAQNALADLPDSTVEIPSNAFSYTMVRNALRDGYSSTVDAGQRDIWVDNYVQASIDVDEVRDQVRLGMDELGRSSQAQALQQMIFTVAGLIVALAVSIGIAFVVARTIAVPLRNLRDSVSRIRDELPALVDQMAEPGKGPDLVFTPIVVNSTDEVAQLATAFNEVNEVTLRVAREQAMLRGSIAEMFVNVARRDQVLLNRQLVFLDELERSEEDPSVLSNLFRLDHLATRMRRNAESLLVLAGIDSGRRVRNAMPLSDVVRTASSEIEQYERVQLDLETDPMMLGHNALPAAHLIAELLENATVFSEPGTSVIVSVMEDARWISVVVNDDGLGMSDEEIDEANERAGTYAASDIVGAQRLGLYVVGRLAYKLGANVRFTRAASGTGTSVRASFSRALFLAPDEVPLDAPIDPLSKESQAATAAWVGPEVADEGAPLMPRRAAEDAEAPLAVPVDLAALTDGSTSTGMPRRRTRAGELETGAPSTAFAPGVGDLNPANIVLPKTVATDLPAEFVLGNEEWMPSESQISISSELPSRGNALPSRSATRPTPMAEPTAPTTTEAALAPVPERAAIFSNFRTRRSIEFLDQAQAVGGASPATQPDDEVGGAQHSMVVPDMVADSFSIPDLSDTTAGNDGHGTPWEPNYASSFGEFGVTRSAEGIGAPTSDTPLSPSELPAATDQGWTEEQTWSQPQAPVDAAAVTWPVRDIFAEPDPEEHERLRSLGAHVGSIASAADLDDDGDYQPRRGRYARYDDDADAQAAAAQPHYADQAFAVDPTSGVEQGYADPGVEADVFETPSFEIPGLDSRDEPAWGPTFGDQDQVPEGVLDEPVVSEEPIEVANPAWDVPDADTVHDDSPGTGRAFGSDAIAPFAVTPGGTELPSFSSVVGSQPPGQAAAVAAPKRSMFGRLFGKRRVEAVAPAPLPAALQRSIDAKAARAAADEPSALPWEVPAEEVSPAPQSWDEPAAAPTMPQTSASPAPADAEPSFAPVLMSPAEPGHEESAGRAPRLSAFFGSRQPETAAPVNVPTSFAPEQGFASEPIAGFAGEPVQRNAGEQAPAFAPAGATSFAPDNGGDSWSGPQFSFDSDLSARLALQAGIQEQALSELSQLSAYRPHQEVQGGGGNLTKRVRSEVPASTEPDQGAQKISRDAAELRARLSSFVSATNRGRQESDPGEPQPISSTPDPAPQSR